MDNFDARISELEAVLFVHGEPMARKELITTLGCSEEDFDRILAAYAARLEEAHRGLALVTLHERIQLVTKPEWGNVIEQFVKDALDDDLTPATLETLAIVAYFGPISRSRIEYQRGVNSIFTLRNLLIRGLIERSPNPDRPSTYLYSPSAALFRHLGIGNAQELPEFSRFAELLKNFETPKETPPPQIPPQ